MGWPAVIVNEMYNVKAYLGVAKPAEQPQTAAPIMPAAPTTLAATSLAPQQGLDVRWTTLKYDSVNACFAGYAEESGRKVNVHHQVETILRRAVLGTSQVELRGCIELVLWGWSKCLLTRASECRTNLSATEKWSHLTGNEVRRLDPKPHKGNNKHVNLIQLAFIHFM